MSYGCAKVAGIQLDEKAVKFLFLPTSEDKEVLGESSDDALVGFIFEMLAQATFLSFVVTGLAVVVAKKVTTAKRHLATVLKLCSLLGMGSLVNECTSHLLLWKGQCSNAPFVGPPPTAMEMKPSMLFISIDSLRQEMFDNSTFPKTLSELMFAGGLDRCTQWPNHDSGAFQSMQGFTSLFYSMRGATYRHFASYKRNKDIQSWPLAMLKDQGYYLHRIKPSNFKYCSIMMEECDLQFRDYHTTDPSRDEIVASGGADRVFENAETWIREWTKRNSSSPFLLTLDFQDIRFPYVVKQDAAPDIHYYEPSLTQSEVYTLKQEASKMNTASIRAIRPKLVNRVKNSMLGLDSKLANFLHTIRLYHSNMIIVLTSDHGELYIDGSYEASFGHAIEDPSDLQRRVPLLFCGPTEIISDLQVPDNVVTSHTDVFPSLLEACGATLGEEWKRELDYRSYFRYRRKGEDGGLAFAHHPWANLAIIQSGSKRLVTRGSTVVTFEDLNDVIGTDKVREDAIMALRGMVPQEKDRHWPGMQPGCDRNDYLTITGGREDLEDGHDDLGIVKGDPAFVGSWLRTAYTMERNFGAAIRENIDPWFTFTSDRNASYVPFTIDVLSVGSVTRPQYLHAQKDTWASHRSVRNFWGLTEHNDFNQTCSDATRADVKADVARCIKYKGFKKSLRHFIGEGYTVSDDRVRKDSGWLCAQRRIGRALAWLKKIYLMEDDLPDYLLLVDDDTYFDLVSFEEYVVRKRLEPSKTEMHGACLFLPAGHIKWSFPYGGFGTVFTRASLKRMLRPIHCKNATSKDEFIQGCCQSLKKNRIGERAVFQEGMSVADLFHVYSALKMFCLHSDWLTGYIANFYGVSQRIVDIEDEEERGMRMHGMAVWPEECGNTTTICVDGSDACHRQGPKDMQHFAMISYSKRPDHYRRAPKLRADELNTTSIKK